MSNAQGNLNCLLSDSDEDEFQQFCIEHLNSGNTSSNLENENEMQIVSDYETDNEINDESADATNANLNEGMVKQMFTGQAIEVLANGIVENFIHYNDLIF